MADQPSLQLRVSQSARRDIAAILRWSRREFGEDARKRYRALLSQAFVDVVQFPDHPGARSHPELGEDVLVYHLILSREKATTPGGIVRRPRHVVVYRRVGDLLEILRILHDARDLKRAFPKPEAE